MAVITQYNGYSQCIIIIVIIIVIIILVIHASFPSISCSLFNLTLLIPFLLLAFLVSTIIDVPVIFLPIFIVFFFFS